MNHNIKSESLEGMNFLNEVIERYPDAISFASGRPSNEFFDLHSWIKNIHSSSAGMEGIMREIKHDDILTQYGKTAGLFNQHLSKYLYVDEGLCLNEDDIVVTNGCQEALAICVDTLFDTNDALLTLDPTYIGIVGVCKIRGIDIFSAAVDSSVSISQEIKKCIITAQNQGKNVRALYLIPDFSNPMGTSLTLNDRKEILALCTEHNISILEDCAYRSFNYSGATLPSMAVLDQNGIVFYIGSFSKTICPGLRMGYILCSSKNGHKKAVVQDLCRVKSFTTLNTPPLTQAIMANVLEKNNYSLKKFIKPALQSYRRNRNRMLESLDQCFSREYKEMHGISWSIPEGGFFMTVKLPFSIDIVEAELCAKKFGIIYVPAVMFSMRNSCRNIIRLSFSYVKHDDIMEGCCRLSSYIKSKIENT